jgi:hypothetical protein
LRIRQTTAVDDIMKDIERAYLSGRIGITDNGEITTLNDAYQDAAPDSTADYHIAPSRETDRGFQRHCRLCDTAYRTSDIKDGRCPFCWRLIG